MPKTVPLDPSAIRVHRVGNGPPVVMMHCLGMTHHLWDCLGSLANKYTLLSYDLPGHGETPVTPENPRDALLGSCSNSPFPSGVTTACARWRGRASAPSPPEGTEAA